MVLAADADRVRELVEDEPAVHLTAICAPGACVIAGERQACEDRKAASLAPKREPGLSDNPKMMDSVEILKLEDDRLAKRLRGICRGC